MLETNGCFRLPGSLPGRNPSASFLPFWPVRDSLTWVSVSRMANHRQAPDEPFHNFRASRSGDQGILCSLGTSWGGF